VVLKTTEVPDWQTNEADQEASDDTHGGDAMMDYKGDTLMEKD